jgi:ABC-type multidrug transport system fused ATPase/permease subunit
VIVIAHRLTTVESVDRIVVLEVGRIIEEGSHLELIGAGGAYAGLLEANAK